jgi:hypothetical protein
MAEYAAARPSAAKGRTGSTPTWGAKAQAPRHAPVHLLAHPLRWRWPRLGAAAQRPAHRRPVHAAPRRNAPCPHHAHAHAQLGRIAPVRSASSPTRLRCPPSVGPEEERRRGEPWLNRPLPSRGLQPQTGRERSAAALGHSREPAGVTEAGTEPPCPFSGVAWCRRARIGAGGCKLMLSVRTKTTCLLICGERPLSALAFCKISWTPKLGLFQAVLTKAGLNAILLGLFLRRLLPS